MVYVKGGLVLIVDDDLDILESLGDFLVKQGFEVASASNGQEALNLLRSGSRPAVIVLDLMMPVMSGHELLARLEQDPQLRDIPVIVISAAPMGNLPASPRFLLPKPFAADDLIHAVAQVAGSTRSAP